MESINHLLELNGPVRAFPGQRTHRALQNNNLIDKRQGCCKKKSQGGFCRVQFEKALIKEPIKGSLAAPWSAKCNGDRRGVLDRPLGSIQQSISRKKLKQYLECVRSGADFGHAASHLIPGCAGFVT